MSNHDPIAASLDPLLERAKSARPIRSDVGALAQAGSPALLTSFRYALDLGETEAATILALAVGAAGGTLDTPSAMRLLPDLDDISHMPVIVGFVEGDRLTMLLDLVDEQRVSWERESLALYLATLSLEDSEPPRRLITQVRSLAREPLGPQAMFVLALAAFNLPPAEIEAVAPQLILLGKEVAKSDLPREFQALLENPVLESLPEQIANEIWGYTFVRPTPKVGRNDPCLCGSGKKYKKCCEARDHQATSHPSRVEQFQKTASRGRVAHQQLFDDLRPMELARLDPSELTTLQIIRGFRRLATHHRWDTAARFVDALAGRDDIPSAGGMQACRLELADMALNAGAIDFAEQRLAHCELSDDDATRYGLRLGMARKSPDTLDRLESALRMAHQKDPSLLIDASFDLLQHYPALGILAARGCISPDRLLDAETLLMEIDRTRDRLDLPGIEPWWELFDRYLEEESSTVDDGRSGREDGESTRRERELDDLQSRLQEANTRVSRLDREIAERIGQLDQVAAERERLASLVGVTEGNDAKEHISRLEEETRRLRAKIGELKGEISEGATRRSEMRRELAHAADERNARSQERSPNRPSANGENNINDVDEAEGESAESRPRKILVPHYSPTATRSLGSVPARIAADALSASAGLASGESRAWSGAKHMRRAHEILTVRIGRSYRLLFQCTGEHLEVLDLVPRGDLEAALERLRKR